MRWTGHVESKGEERKLYKVLVGKIQGKRSFGKSRPRWEDGIKIG
jgi:hypothetical protein